MNVQRTGTDSAAGRLIEFASGLTWESAPSQVRRSAAVAVLDTLGCAFFGAQFPWGAIAGDFAVDQAPDGPATVVGRGTGSIPSLAALSNGTASHGFEVDDIVPGALVHPGAVIVPAALAAAEQTRASGKELLAGVLAGYEAMARLGRALGPEHNNNGYHTTAVAGPVAAAVAASRISGADAVTTARACGIACSMSSGLKAFTQGTGGMVKRLHAGLGAQNGILAWQLAARGFTAPLQAIDGHYGLLQVIGGPTSDPTALSAGLGEDWAITRLWVKAFPCCGLIHTTAQALSELKASENISPEQIASVRVGLSHHAVDHNGASDPADTMAAQYSVPYCAAVALTGDVTDPRSFLAEGLKDPTPRALIPRIALHVDEEVEEHFPERFGARVNVRLHDGRELDRTLWYARGTPVDACSETEIVQKFHKLCATVMSSEQARRIEDAVLGLAEAETLAPFIAAMRAAPSTSSAS
jgi:2-methylcitrate dehydratase PrpD